MKKSKRLIAGLLIAVVFMSIIIPFSGKVSKAADFNAKVFLLNGTWSSDYYLRETNREQYYQITIPSDGKLNLRAMSYFGSYKYDSLIWELYNADLSKRLADNYVSGTETSPETQSSTWILSAGTYYYKVSSGDGTGKYKLYGQFTSYGVNDQSAISYDLPLAYQLGDTITGALTKTDREDWYKIVIPSSGYYTQKMVSYFGSYKYDSLMWELYNADLSKCLADNYVCGTETSPKTQKTDIVLSKGTYYVKLYSGDGTGKYTFQYTKLTKSSCSHDYEKTWHDTTYFKRGYNYYHCKKCGHSYKGDYESVKKLGQAYISYYSSVGKGKIKLSWGTVSDASGYQIRYSRKGNMKNSKTISVKGQSKSNKTIKKLSRHKKYYVQVRAYKKSGSKKVYGKWSLKKYFKTE